MSKVIGIDLGTTFSAIASLDDLGNPEVLASIEDNRKITASAVYLKDKEVIVGDKALNYLKDQSKNVILQTKREMENDIVYSTEEGKWVNDKTLVEGAGALGLAALLESKERKKSDDIGVIACGGNLDSRVLSSLLMRELVRKRKVLTLSIDMEDKPGQLSEISKLCSREKINILAVEHSRFTLDLSVRAARLNITLETQDKKHANKIINLIKKLGFKVREKVEN